MVAIVGFSVLAFGAALLVLPGPAFVVIPVGTAILAVEFLWARRLLLVIQGRILRLAAQARSGALAVAGIARFRRGGAPQGSAPGTDPDARLDVWDSEGGAPAPAAAGVSDVVRIGPVPEPRGDALRKLDQLTRGRARTPVPTKELGGES
ncbi:MAG: PGPGW domain-containing protein [Myxococcota bacterium]